MTQDQQNAVDLARQMGCEVFHDSARPKKNEAKFTRIKGANAWGLYDVFVAAFGVENVRKYKAKKFFKAWGHSDEVPALSIRRTE